MHDFEVLDVSGYKQKKVPSSKWRELIKKIYEVDPLACPCCQSEMRIISFIDEYLIVKKILEHLDLWREKQPRAPPEKVVEITELTYETIDDGWYQSENTFVWSWIVPVHEHIWSFSPKTTNAHFLFNRLILKVLNYV